MRRLVTVFSSLILFSVLGLVAWKWVETPGAARDSVVETAVHLLEPARQPGGPEYSFVIDPGEDAASVSQRLADAGVVRRPELLRLLLRYYGADRGVRAGTYTIPSDISLIQLVAALKEGQTELVRVTIVEGWRAEEVADALDAAGIANRDEFLGLVYAPGGRNAPLSPDGRPGSTLEGYLFPDTYLVPPDYGARPFLDLVLATFAERVGPEVRAAGPTLSGPDRLRPPLEAVVALASIVEREAQVREEQAVIAATYLNRLSDGMNLAADPTVQYALIRQGQTQPAGGYWKQQLTVEDLKVGSPFNTYVAPGLPPTPIANPGLGALRAVLNPATAPYRFFVARPDGSHAFATTFEEHLRNVSIFQR